jgi:hypothetical protein
MTTRTGEESRTADPAAAPREPAEPLAQPELASPAYMLTLQRAVGNQAVGRILARLRARWSTQADAQATATATRMRLRTELLTYMARSSRRIVRNTAELFTGTAPLLTLDATTKRSDSAVQVASPTAAAWVFPARLDAFFRGVWMNNVELD